MAMAKRHHAHASNLNQYDYHRLPEYGPVGVRVMDDQACYTGG